MRASPNGSSCLCSLLDPSSRSEAVQSLRRSFHHLERWATLPSDEGSLSHLRDVLLQFEEGQSGTDTSSVRKAPPPIKVEPTPVNERLSLPATTTISKSLPDTINLLVSLLKPKTFKFIEEQIREAVPLLPGTPEVVDIDLGSAIPYFSCIQADLGPSGNIEMRTNFDFTSDLHVQLNVMNMPVGITGMSIKGELIISLGPPSDAPPFFGGVQIFFANPPEIEVKFEGLARLADLPVLRATVRDAVTSKISDVCVLPSMLAIDLNPKDDVGILDLSFPDPKSVLRLTLWSAENLVAADVRLFSAPSSDPYVVFLLGKQTWVSPVVNTSLNPKWGTDNEGLTTSFMVHDDSQCLHIRVFDSDFAFSDDRIGHTTIKLGNLQKGGKQKLKLRKDDGQEGGGTITISAKILSLSAEGNRGDDAMITAILFVKLITVGGLDPSSLYPFRVRVRVFHPNDSKEPLAECTSKSGQTPINTKLSLPVKRTCIALSEAGWDAMSIADVVDVNVVHVEDFLCCLRDKKKEHSEELAQDARMSVKQPHFEEILQLLVPATQPNDEVEIALLDANSTIIGRAKLSIAQICDSKNLTVHGPFQTDTGARIYGNVRLRWAT